MTLSLDKLLQRCLNLTMAMPIKGYSHSECCTGAYNYITNVDTAQSSMEFRLGRLAEVYDSSNSEVKEPCIRYWLKGGHE